MTAAPFFSRNGTLLGVHNKNMLYDPEEDYGVSPGEHDAVINTVC